MSANSNRRQWSEDEATIAQLGGAFSSQVTRLQLRIPNALARMAVQAWERDDPGDMSDVEPAPDTITRHRAASLALIGLTIREHGRPEADVVVVELDPWLVGDALLAAIDIGLSE